MNTLEILNEALEKKYKLTEAKEDKERFLNFAGQDLYDRFETLKSKQIIKGQDADYTYWEKQSLNALKDFIEKTEAKQEERNKERTAVTQHYRQISDLTEGKDYNFVYSGNGWTIYEVLTHKASMWLGRDTKWCITMKDKPSFFNQYRNKGANYYFLIPDKNPESGKWCYLYYNKELKLSDNYFFDSQDKSYTIDIVDVSWDILLYLPGISQKLIDCVKERQEIRKEVQKTGVYTYNPLDNKDFIRGLNPKKIIVPDSVKELEYHAFYDCRSLQEITLPNSIKKIGSDAFEYCTSLKEIIIPNSVTQIGSWAFEYCTSLKEITIPNSVTQIGDYAFCDCTSLQEICFSCSVKEIGQHVFENCNSLKEITIPNKVKCIWGNAFGCCTSLQKIILPDSIEKIWGNAFWGCKSLQEIKIKGEYRPQIFKCIGLNDTIILNWVDCGIKETWGDIKDTV